MKISFIKTQGYVFTLKNSQNSVDIDKEDVQYEVDAFEPLTLTQKPKGTTLDKRVLLKYFFTLFITSPIRAFFLFRKRIHEEESPVFLECELEGAKNADESVLYFNKSEYSSYDSNLSKPHIDADKSVTVKNIRYFADPSVIEDVKKRQLCRKLANVSFLFTLNTIFFIYTVIEKVFNASAFSLYIYIPIILGTAFTLIKASKRFKVYLREVNARVTYLNDHARDKGGSAGLKD